MFACHVDLFPRPQTYPPPATNNVPNTAIFRKNHQQYRLTNPTLSIPPPSLRVHVSTPPPATVDMYTPLLLLALAAQSLAAPTQLTTNEDTIESRQTSAVLPQLKRATILANVTQPSVDRDSCGSSRIGNRAFWTCRDTLRYDAKSGRGVLPLAANTGGWSDLTTTGPLISKSNNAVGVASSGKNPIRM